MNRAQAGGTGVSGTVNGRAFKLHTGSHRPARQAGPGPSKPALGRLGSLRPLVTAGSKKSLIMATSDNEILVDLNGENSGAVVSSCSASHRRDRGSIVPAGHVGGNIAAEPPSQPNLVRTEIHSDKLSTTSLHDILFSDLLLKWSSISIGAYIGSFLRIGLTYLKIW
jgi:hypothetical protein